MEPNTPTTKPKNNVALIIGVVVVIAALIIGGVIIYNRNKSSNEMGDMGNTTTTSTDTSTATETNSVMVMNYAFSPSVIKVKVGTKVTWTNMDSVSHTITADTSSNDAPDGPLFGNNETYSFTFNKAGTYTYHCQPHPYMKGTVVVTE